MLNQVVECPGGQKMTIESLEQKMKRFSSPVQMLRSAPALKYPFPFASEHSSWLDEQVAWRSTAVLFDQGKHMTDNYFKGPDVKRLFAEISINGFSGFGKNKAKQIVCCNDSGYVIGDSILFGLDDDEYLLIGYPTVGNWAEYHAGKHRYDVEITHDPASLFNKNPRLTYRFQINGPASQQILERAIGRKLDPIKFFHMGELKIAGCRVRALNHTMSGLPGDAATGLEMWGPLADREKVFDALLAAGSQFGMRQGGVRSYLSSTIESGWIPTPTPAIYTGEELRPYREWLTVHTYEANAGLEGSFTSDNIEDYYQTPWDLGYDRFIRFDHEFIGRSALAALAKQPHRRKVWLRWNSQDVSSVMCRSLFDKQNRPRMIDIPNTAGAAIHFDTVKIGNRFVGVSTCASYTRNLGALASLAMIDEVDVAENGEVTLIWGQQDGGASKPFMEPHVQTEIRATMQTRPLV